MVDDRLIRRIDLLVAILSVWLLLSLVVASFALMLFDMGVGVAALATVVLTVVVTVVSFLRSVSSATDAPASAR